MKTIIQLAKELSNQLTTSERRDENKTKYVHLKDGFPQWMQDVCHKAHGDRMQTGKSSVYLLPGQLKYG